MDIESKTYKTPSYMRKATLKYYYKCKEDPSKQTHIKARQQKNAKSYYERNKEMIKAKERARYAKKKEEKLAQKALVEIMEDVDIKLKKEIPNNKLSIKLNEDNSIVSIKINEDKPIVITCCKLIP